MKVLLLLLVSVLFLFSLGACSANQNPPAPDQRNAESLPAFRLPEDAAKDGLATLKSEADDYVRFGFQNKAEVDRAKLGMPEKVLTIPVDQLAGYKEGTDIRPLLQDVHRMVYPVTVDGQGRALITIKETPSGWQLVGFGQSQLAKNLVDAKRASLERANFLAPNSGPGESFALQIQTQRRRDYLANVEAGPGRTSQIMLTPLNAPPQKQEIANKDQRGKHELAVGIQRAEKYSKSIYVWDARTTEYAIDPSKLASRRQTAGEVLTTLAPLARYAQSHAGPPQ